MVNFSFPVAFLPVSGIIISVPGVWRSLVARTAGGREVAGSNPVTPMIRKEKLRSGRCHISCRLASLFVTQSLGKEGLGYDFKTMDTEGIYGCGCLCQLFDFFL